MTLQWRFDIEAKVTAFLRALPALAILSSAHHWVSNSGSNCLRLVCLSRSRGGRKSEKEEQNKLVNYLELLPIAAAAAVSQDSDNVRIQRVPNVDTRGAVLYLTLPQSTCVNVRIFFCTYEQQTVIMYVAYSTHWNWTSIISGCLILLCLSVQSLFYLHHVVYISGTIHTCVCYEKIFKRNRCWSILSQFKSIIIAFVVILRSLRYALELDSKR